MFDKLKNQLDEYVKQHMTSTIAGLLSLAKAIRSFVLDNFDEVDSCFVMPDSNDYTLVVRIFNDQSYTDLNYNTFGSMNDQWLSLNSLPIPSNNKSNITHKLACAGLGMYFRRPYLIHQQVYDLIVANPTGTASDWRESAINSGIPVAWPEYKYRDVYRRVAANNDGKYTRYKNAVVISRQLWFKDEEYISEPDSTHVALDVVASELGIDKSGLWQICRRYGVSIKDKIQRSSNDYCFRHISIITQEIADRIRAAYAYIKQHPECQARCLRGLVIEKFIKHGCVNPFKSASRIARNSRIGCSQFVAFVKRQIDIIPYGRIGKIAVFTDKQAAELMRRYKKSKKS